MRRIIANRLLPGFVFLVMIGMLLSCAEKIVNDDNSGRPASVAFKLTGVSEQMADRTVRFTITGPGIDTPIVRTIVMVPSGGAVEGTLDSIPAGRDRKFDAEVLILQDVASQALYRGTAVADVGPDVETTLNLKLYPVLPLVKLSPGFVSTQLKSPFSIDFKAYNMKALAACTVSFQMTLFDMTVDSIVKGLSLPADAQLSYSAYRNFIYIYVSRPNTPGGILVDDSGNATLAIIHMHSDTILDTTASTESNLIAFSYTNLRDAAGNSIVNFYTDGATVQIYRGVPPAKRYCPEEE